MWPASASEHEMGDGYVWEAEAVRGVINLFVSFPQRGLFKGFALIFSPFGQEPSPAIVGHENDLRRRWLDDNHTCT